jgi:hypothetical protein
LVRLLALITAFALFREKISAINFQGAACQEGYKYKSALCHLPTRIWSQLSARHDQKVVNFLPGRFGKNEIDGPPPAQSLRSLLAYFGHASLHSPKTPHKTSNSLAAIQLDILMLTLALKSQLAKTLDTPKLQLPSL